MKNRAIIDMMEPGSTFKIVSVAAALNEHKVQLGFDHFLRERPLELWRDRFARSRPFGDLSVQDILVKSSNIGAAKLALSVGEQKFYEYIRRFGFGERTGIELPGEIPGLDSPAAGLEQDFHHSHPDGTRSRSHSAANDHGHGDDRQRRKTHDAAHRQVDHDGGRQDHEHVFRRLNCDR